MLQLLNTGVPTTMPGIFISYRREDSAAYAGRLYDRLANQFGKDNVFMDIDSIEPGLDFIEVLERTISKCDAVVVVIGKQWLAATDTDGRRRLDNPEDLVRVEVAAALDRKIRVVPALVGGARMPSSHELPQAITPLSRRNALEINDLSFHQSVARLIDALDKSIAKAQPPAAPVAIQQESMPPQPVPEQVRGLRPTTPVNDQSVQIENPNARVPFLRRVLLLYRPHGNADWVSWAWVWRIIFGLSPLSFLIVVVLKQWFDLVWTGWLQLSFLFLGVVFVGSRFAASWCDTQAFQRKGWLSSASKTPSLSVPRWRRTLLLYLPQGAPGWVLMSWAFRLLVLLSGTVSCFFVAIAFKDLFLPTTDLLAWASLFGFTAATVLLRFIASWFDKLAARG